MSRLESSIFDGVLGLASNYCMIFSCFPAGSESESHAVWTRPTPRRPFHRWRTIATCGGLGWFILGQVDQPTGWVFRCPKTYDPRISKNLRKKCRLEYLNSYLLRTFGCVQVNAHNILVQEGILQFPILSGGILTYPVRWMIEFSMFRVWNWFKSCEGNQVARDFDASPNQNHHKERWQITGAEASYGLVDFGLAVDAPGDPVKSLTLGPFGHAVVVYNENGSSNEVKVCRIWEGIVLGCFGTFWCFWMPRY